MQKGLKAKRNCFLSVISGSVTIKFHCITISSIILNFFIGSLVSIRVLLVD